MKEVKVVRTHYYVDRTLGKMYIDGKFFGYTLEDAVRGDGIKIKHHTAIPEGMYPIKLTRSGRWKREMPQIMDVPMFTGIRVHGGNGPEDTSGCILVGRDRHLLLKQKKISNSLIHNFEEKIKNFINASKDIYIHIINLNKRS